MANTLHQQLKDRYSTPESRQEAMVDQFRIDVCRGQELIEIQTSPLGSIRDKVRQLLLQHQVTVVKPIIARKLLVTKSRPRDAAPQRRWSPKRGTWLDLFEPLAHFTTVFPHPRLTIELPLIEIEEWRVRRRARRSWGRNYRVEDQRLTNWMGVRVLRSADDLFDLLPSDLPAPFDTRHLAQSLETPRWMAQKIAYCLRQTGAASVVGKRGNAMLYQVVRDAAPPRVKKRRRERVA